MQRYQVIILGANGQLGSDLVKMCDRDKISYLGVTQDDFNALTDELEVKFSHIEADYIINCIATTNVDGCEDDANLPFNLNANFVYKLAKFCVKRDITLFHVSTDYVFDGKKTTAYFEADLPNPLNIYGLSKLTGDKLVQLYMQNYFIFRVSSLFGKAGASGKGGNFITTMQRLGRERESLSVIADQITCPTATLDIARAMVYFIKSKITEYGVYNCVSTNSCSWFDFARSIFIHSGLSPDKISKAMFADYKFKAARPQYAVLSTAKISKYYKMPMWEDSLAEYFSGLC